MTRAAGDPLHFPWRRMMEFGLGRLGRSPGEFWAMTPKELEAAITGLAGPLPMPLSRAALDQLIARYPDAKADTGKPDGQS